MRTRFPYILLVLSILAAIVAVVTPTPSQAGGLFDFGKKKKSTTAATSVEVLAEQIDKLEECIEEYGSVVAKKPDVWGEARMTQHRAQVEEILSSKLESFETTLNGSLVRSDQAFAATAMSLGMAIGGPQTSGYAPNASTEMTQTVLAVPTPADSAGALSGFNDAIQRSPDSRRPLIGKFDQEKISLEPTVYLDQLNRYLQHLNELRRINEGDDVGDSPGYTINLVRIPVSVLPGKETRQGYGAEITVTAEPYLSDDTLPEAFRTMVINDLVDELTLPVLKLVDEKAWEETDKLYEESKILQKSFLGAPVIGDELRKRLKCCNVPPLSNEYEVLLLHATLMNAVVNTVLNQPVDQKSVNDGSPITTYGMLNSDNLEQENIDNKLKSWRKYYQSELYSSAMNELDKLNEDVANLIEKLNKTALAEHPSRSRRARYSVPATSRFRVYGRAYHYLPNDDNNPYRMNRLIEIAERVEQQLGTRKHNGKILLGDAREYLREELKAAYDFLHLKWFDLGFDAITVQLHNAIRTGNDHLLDQLQRDYGHKIRAELAKQGDDPFHITKELGWCILVEMALINQELIDDMNRIASAKNANCLVGQRHMQFYLPKEQLVQTQYECIHMFNEYVRCKWPIKTFAIDPVTSDQNIADAFSMRREMQLAASLAFATGNINANQLSKFARRIELDAETIALNRTAVGFSHGNNTFGWRFYPRFQTPDIKGNFQTFFETQFTGGPTKDKLLRERKLEQSQRECTAVLICPGFVPYMLIDVRANWFNLCNPSEKKFGLQDTVQLSRDVVALRSARDACVRDAHLYRDGEVHRLMRSVDQLEERLPLQTMYVRMPIEDSKGGFQLLSSGMTNLGPELIGFYGEPGYDPTKSCSFFLIGDNFSINATHVIVGGKSIDPPRPGHPHQHGKDVSPAENSPAANDKPATGSTGAIPSTGTGTTPSSPPATPGAQDYDVEIVSREILHITVPAGLIDYPDPNGSGSVISVRIATPYGVSSEITIPVVNKKPMDAKSEADKAVAKHVEEHHPMTFDWKKPLEAKAVVYREDAILERVILQSPYHSKGGKEEGMSIRMSGTAFPSEKSADSPFGANLIETGRKADVAAFLIFKSKDAKKKDVKVPQLIKNDLRFFNVQNNIKTYESSKPLPLADLENALKAGLGKVESDFDIKEIEVQAFLRFHQGDTDVPIHRVLSPIKITVSETIDLRKTVLAPPAPAPDGMGHLVPNPFEEAISSEPAELPQLINPISLLPIPRE